MLLVGGFYAWNRWGAEHVSRQFYGVKPDSIHVTERPAYIPADIVEAVYRDTRLDQLSLLDPAAAARIASAFSSNAWVRRVVAVRKLPGGAVDVHLQYRRPVAMVFVISRHPDISGGSFFAIDEDGVLLPTAGFTRQETMDYVHIEVPDVYPTGGVGSPFGDSRVVSAAKLAAVIQPYRESMRLKSIRLHDSSRVSPVPQFQLLAADGQDFLWGSSPGQETHGESTLAIKVKKLLEQWGLEASGQAASDLNSRAQSDSPDAAHRR